MRADGLSRQFSSDSKFAKFAKPSRACLPLLPDDGAKPSVEPGLQVAQDAGRFAKAKVSEPSTQVPIKNEKTKRTGIIWLT